MKALPIKQIKVYPFYTGDERLIIHEVKTRSFAGKLVVPEYLIEIKGVKKFIKQRTLVRNFAPEFTPGKILGEVAFGNQHTEHRWIIQYDEKEGVVLRAPGYFSGSKWVYNNRFFDSYKYDITEFVNAGILKMWSEFSGIGFNPTSVEELNCEIDCKQCKGYRYLIGSDVLEGDSVQGCQIASKNTLRAKDEGPYDVRWHCVLTEECPSAQNVETGNFFARRGENGNHEHLVKLETQEAAQDCPYYAYRGSYAEGKKGRKAEEVPFPVIAEDIAGAKKYTLSTFGIEIKFTFPVSQ